MGGRKEGDSVLALRAEASMPSKPTDQSESSIDPGVVAPDEIVLRQPLAERMSQLQPVSLSGKSAATRAGYQDSTTTEQNS